MAVTLLSIFNTKEILQDLWEKGHCRTKKNKKNWLLPNLLPSSAIKPNNQLL